MNFFVVRALPLLLSVFAVVRHACCRARLWLRLPLVWPPNRIAQCRCAAATLNCRVSTCQREREAEWEELVGERKEEISEVFAILRRFCRWQPFEVNVADFCLFMEKINAPPDAAPTILLALGQYQVHGQMMPRVQLDDENGKLRFDPDVSSRRNIPSCGSYLHAASAQQLGLYVELGDVLPPFRCVFHFLCNFQCRWPADEGRRKRFSGEDVPRTVQQDASRRPVAAEIG